MECWTTFDDFNCRAASLFRNIVSSGHGGEFDVGRVKDYATTSFCIYGDVNVGVNDPPTNGVYVSCSSKTSDCSAATFDLACASTTFVVVDTRDTPASEERKGLEYHESAAVGTPRWSDAQG